MALIERGRSGEGGGMEESGLDAVLFKVSLICDKSVTTQNLAFLSYWYRKKRFADALLTGIVS